MQLNVRHIDQGNLIFLQISAVHFPHLHVPRLAGKLKPVIDFERTLSCAQKPAGKGANEQRLATKHARAASSAGV